MMQHMSVKMNIHDDHGFVCTLCNQPWKEPVTTDCNHTFCQSCLTIALKARKWCPSCAVYCEKQTFPVDYLKYTQSLWRWAVECPIPKEITGQLAWEAYENGKVEAVRGDKRAMYFLGMCNFHGIGVLKDPKAAVNWWWRAAELLEPRSMQELAMCYIKGEGIKENPELAVQWLRKASNRNDLIATFNLARCLQRGVGVPESPSESFKHFSAAAAKGHIESMHEVGVCYHEGYGCEPDATKAVKWWSEAAEQNFALSQYNLACAYETGEGVAKDMNLAEYWWRKAAGSHDDAALRELEKLIPAA